MLCRLTSRNQCPVGIVEGTTEESMLATSLNKPNSKGQVKVNCINPTNQPINLTAGNTIDSFMGVEEADVQNCTTPGAEKCFKEEGPVPTHVQQLYDSACQGCQDTSQEEKLAALLTEYSLVFSKDDNDMD